MMEKKTKYDTNPLDPDFVRRTDEVRAATSDVPKTGATEEPTRRIDGGGVDGEAPTRYYPQPSQYDSQSQSTSQYPYNSQAQYNAQAQYDNAGQTSYPSVFIPPTYQPPQNYQGATSHASAAPFPYKQTPSSRTLPGIGMPENLAMILPYLPFPLVGVVPGVLELLLVPRTETRTRFHAAQGLALHLAVLIIGLLFSTADSIISGVLHGPLPFMLRLASGLFTTAATVYFIISMIRVWKGKPHVVAPLAEATRWLNEKFEPRK